MEGGSRKGKVTARWGSQSQEVKRPRRLGSWVTDMKGMKGLMRFVFVITRKIVLVKWGMGASRGEGGRFPGSGTLPFYRKGNRQRDCCVLPSC